MAPADPLARLKRASALLGEGRAAEAADLFAELAKANPRQPELQNNLGVALKAAGRPKEAVAAYRRAVRLKPDYAVAHANLARLLAQSGEGEEALGHFETAHRLAPEAGHLGELVDALAALRFARPNPRARALLTALFERGDIDLQRLMPAALSLVLAPPKVAAGAEAAWAWLRSGGTEPAPPPLPEDALLDRLLVWTTVADPRVEAWLTAERRRLLDRFIATGSTGLPALRLAALALQAMAAEHAWAETAAEGAAVAALLADLGPTPDERVLLAALYRDPAGFAPPPEKAPAGRDALAQFALRAVAEPAAERILAETLPTLTAIADETSGRVRAQYETHPYPRWRSVDGQLRRRRLDAHLAQRFPAIRFAGLALTAPRILVAGCGTGRHAIQTAQRYDGSDVLAVDLSRRSLAYAKRMADSLGVANIAFAQADILGLAALDRRFDLVECSGVLHHMAEPLAGWRVLRGLVKPGGLMRIALYSETARARFASLRAEIAANEPETIAAEIRARRQDILRLPPDDPAAVVWRTGDFYSLSGCRDLLYHRREVRFTWPAIADALAELQLRLVGVEVASPALLDRYRARFPNDPTAIDPVNWHRIEEEMPDAFLAMYQFWCQAADG